MLTHTHLLLPLSFSLSLSLSLPLSLSLLSPSPVRNSILVLFESLLDVTDPNLIKQRILPAMITLSNDNDKNVRYNSIKVREKERRRKEERVKWREEVCV